MGRSPSSGESGLKKGPWTPDEDEKLVKYVKKHGHSSWSALPKLAGTTLYLVKAFFIKLKASHTLYFSLCRS